MKKMILILALALALTVCAWAEEVTPGAYVADYFNVIADLEVGAAGYSLKLAETVCAAVGFADANVTDTDAASDAMLTAAWEALDAEKQERFAENFPEIAALAEESFDSYTDAQPLFEDAGVDEAMSALAASEEARAKWEALTARTEALLGSDE